LAYLYSTVLFVTVSMRVVNIVLEHSYHSNFVTSTMYVYVNMPFLLWKFETSAGNTIY